ncbi:Alpha-1,6-mannosylglycoprotein 6-beta-N-acetylglucosaminyltransferase A [Desmophyllum pertusum]|uniref:alpha-1,6-mannosyl-glycoprotein 6-beta-N-acetylglucosaminyltransferase n=1 Tax=Desmophyllum pertusum TaxID=174260 RepID=A0A9W9Z0P8_9CNID|nr:Alpha-1,6-mannosylglycoprotein 6-beta-N-acetylglucosaminyltransferase A [Desmophyllum pertusum]
MRRLLSKRTFGLICAGLLVFFLTAQISIFQVTLHVGDSGVTFSLRQQTTVRIFNEAHTFLNVPNNLSDGVVTCDIPEDRLFPLCSMKIKEFNKTWNENCHGEKYKVDPSSMCSVIQYLSEIQAWCPVLPWRQHRNPFNVGTKQQKASIQTDLAALLKKFEGDVYAWMRQRIVGTWTYWISAIEELRLMEHFQERKRKKILIYMASLAQNAYIFKTTLKGGPLGELTQWCDLICALHILGHDLTIGFMKEHLPSTLLLPASDGCARHNMTDGLDIIFTDIQGVNVIADRSGPDYSRHKCKLRSLDSFGTDAEFNYKHYKEEIPGGRSAWGSLDIQLSQILTMYPHSPDNSFLGFAVPRRSGEHETLLKRNKTRNAALVYGKEPEFWKGYANYINAVKRHFSEVHATLGGTKEIRQQYVPEYVIDHGIVNITTLINLLESSKVFVGLGQPFEGPAALEALANGCFFINPKYVPPLDRTNANFWAGKPLSRKITSQNPYAEVFVGKPFVQTVDINNLTEVEEALREITNTKEEPHLPFEFTHAGMLERVNAYVENQNFCKPTNWPPLSELKMILGGEGEACVEACLKKQLTCEPTFFASLNTKETLERVNFRCKSTVFHESILAPSMNTADNTCQLQSQPLLFSCRAAKPGVVRVCPCRSYRKEQVALCESCR